MKQTEKDNTVTHEIAVNEFGKWIDAKKVSKRRREGLVDMEEEIIDAIQEGSLVLDDQTKFVQHLKFPNERIKTLTFQTRIQIGVLNARLKNVSTQDVNGRLEAYISALTGEPTPVIKTLDSSDFNLSSCIATYFL